MRLSGWTLTVCLILVAPSAWAQPAQPGEKCTESAELLLLVSQDEPRVAIPGFPVTMRGTRSQLVTTRCQKRLPKPLPTFAWKVEAPDGRVIFAQGTSTLLITFTPQVVGPHKVTLIGCPKVCKLNLLVDFSSTNKPIREVVELGPEPKTVVVAVAAQAQLAPLFTPPPRPGPLVSDGAGGFRRPPATQPGLAQYRLARDQCGRADEIGAGISPQWFTTAPFPQDTHPYTLVEGRVYHTLVSRKDHPKSHHSNDASSLIEVDPHYQHLLAADTAVDKGAVLPVGGLEIEWETNELPEPFRTTQGDRLSALGFHVIDCGHEKFTEIHPPIAVAVHRPRAVTLPEVVAFEEGTAAKPIGRNVVTPGIVTDIWVSLRGGQALDCNQAAVHQPNRVPQGPIAVHPCVPQPTAAGVRFQFHVFLPLNPATRVEQVGLTGIARPGLFLRVEDHPDAAALRARTDLPVRIIERRLDVEAPYVTVEVGLSGLGAGQRFAKRIQAAWVYPDITGDNFQLRAMRVRLKELKVTDDGDPFQKGDGDWKFWGGVPSLNQPWTQLIDCPGCVEETTYGPGSGVFRPQALTVNGAFGGEVRLFAGQALPIQFGGFEEDLVTSDDTGTVLRSLSGPGTSFNARSTCDDQTVGLKNEVTPDTSGCAAYSITWDVVATGPPVRAVLSPEGREFASRLMVRPDDRSKMPDPLEPDLYRHDVISSSKKALTEERKDEVEEWQAALAVERLRAQLKEPDAETLALEIRENALKQLGPNPTEKHRQKVALELRELKKALPEAVYKKHLCEVETGKKCQ